MAIDVQPAVTPPHLVVDDAPAAIDFYVKAFGATEIGRVPPRPPDGKLIHAALQINGAMVMLNDDFPPEMSDGKSMTPPALGGTPVTIHLTVTDVDDKFQRALDAGATVVMPLEDQFWGAIGTAWSWIRSGISGRWASRSARSATTRSSTR